MHELDSCVVYVAEFTVLCDVTLYTILKVQLGVLRIVMKYKNYIVLSTCNEVSFYPVDVSFTCHYN